ncbi:energy-coupling factor transporter transmembrane component T family protein [Limosilactobacillus ingluviei]|uniref:ABC transporter, permease protein n=1 Tax=Limosilactobacillus ingluviei DSM 15946 TaxID=1423760 RepID=A0A0R1UIF5_9LACO|nr:energy-coupling factor transporter transmembrane component T [Limosilactobacillus ingluviei]KRL90645.1 ABC transporter, permease protein [Limosilactobacillus ingluviei DSM 15946]
MNPSLKLLLVLLLSLEISFTQKLVVNLLLIAVGLGLVIATRPGLLTLLRLLVVPAIPAATLSITIGLFTPGHDWFFAAVLASRVYVYVLLGSAVTLSTPPLRLARSLEQNAHLPAKFAYGTLAAINLLPRIVTAVKTIKAAGQMRGVTLSFWSPRLYFKAILSAITWSEQLAQAMESHGFVENQPRTVAQPIPLSKIDWLRFVGSFGLAQVVLIAFP